MPPLPLDILMGPLPRKSRPRLKPLPGTVTAMEAAHNIQTALGTRFRCGVCQEGYSDERICPGCLKGGYYVRAKRIARGKPPPTLMPPGGTPMNVPPPPTSLLPVRFVRDGGPLSLRWIFYRQPLLRLGRGVAWAGVIVAGLAWVVFG